MKKKYIKALTLLLLLFIGHSSFCQTGWTQKANFPGGPRAWTSGFTIGHYAFVGLGNNGNYLFDFWKWNETTNTWSPIPNYPGGGSLDATAFTIEGKGYVCFGLSGSGVQSDLWRYDTSTNSWTQMATFPGAKRYDCEAFVIGHKAYIVAGSGGGPPYYKDVWVYDAHANSWTQKANWPGGSVEEPICFAIGKHGYVGDGWYPGCTDQMYRYDTTTDKWTAIAKVPPLGGITEQPDAWVIGSKAYLCTGADCNAAGLRDGWMYDTVTNSWCEFTRISNAKLARGNGVAFTINNNCYFSTGQDTNLKYLGDLWEYTPSAKINVRDTFNACTGDSVHFSDSSSYIASAWNWSFPGGSPGSSNIQNPTIYYTLSGTYNVRLILTGCGLDDTLTRLVHITASLPMTLSTNVISNENCAGECNGSAITTIIGGTPPYTYNWAPTGGSNAKATGLCMGTYTITLTDVFGCSGTTFVTITQPTPITITKSINNIACNGGLGNANVNTSGGTSPYTYLWTPSGQTTNTATGLSAGNYTINVTDANGCTSTMLTTITQPTLLTANINLTNNILCNQGLGGASVIAKGGTAPYTYFWMPSGGTNANATGLSAGLYTVTLTDSNGCNATASVNITQPAVLTTSITSIIPASCNLPNGSAMVTVNGGTIPYTYLWTPSGQTKTMATGLSVGTYTITVTDKNQCTENSTVTITQPSTITATISAFTNVSCYNGNNGTITVTASGGKSPYTYLWTPSGNTTASPNNLFALTYTVTVTDLNGCISTITATLTQPALLSVTIYEPKNICKDSTGDILAIATNGTAPYTYAWSAGITSTTSTATVTPIITRDYSVTVTDAHGCTASGNILLQYGPDLFVSIIGKTSICKGYSTTICASVAGGQGGNTYLWQPVNVTDVCITIYPSSTSTYTVSVVDGCGATTTANTTVYTNPPPTVDMSANLYEGCAPLCVQFYNATTLSQGKVMQYIWTFGNGDTIESINPAYCYSASGTYNVSLSVTSDSGCSATLDKVNLITVYKHPEAVFTYSPLPINILNPTVQFVDQSTDAYGISYRIWSFGDGGYSDAGTSLTNPSHTYQDTGIYCPKLIVENDKGCIDTITECLEVQPLFTLYIPSAFSPNGDGTNDVFKAKGTYIKSFEMYVFDRWGIQLFHSTNIDQGWDGTVGAGNVISQEDTYVYVIHAIDWNHVPHSYVGAVNLLK